MSMTGRKLKKNTREYKKKWNSSKISNTKILLGKFGVNSCHHWVYYVYILCALYVYSLWILLVFCLSSVCILFVFSVDSVWIWCEFCVISVWVLVKLRSIWSGCLVRCMWGVFCFGVLSSSLCHSLLLLPRMGHSPVSSFWVHSTTPTLSSNACVVIETINLAESHWEWCMPQHNLW